MCQELQNVWITMKYLKTKLLFALNSEGEDDYHPYSFLYFRASEFDRGSIRDAVGRLVAKKAIDRITRSNNAYFRITGVGREMLAEKLGKNRKVTGWDKKWRIVILNGLGDDQRQLAKTLVKIGYKRAARGVYITPLPVTEATKRLIVANGWSDRLQMVEAKKLIIGDDIQLTRMLWHLESLSGELEEFIRVADRLLKMARKNNMLLSQSKGGFKEVFDRYFNLELKDPNLPKKLMPNDWPAEKAGELFSRLVVLANTAGV